MSEFKSIPQFCTHCDTSSGPNFGGLWESAIEIAKRRLLKMSKGSLMTSEELATLLRAIEACVPYLLNLLIRKP